MRTLTASTLGPVVPAPERQASHGHLTVGNLAPIQPSSSPEAPNQLFASIQSLPPRSTLSLFHGQSSLHRRAQHLVQNDILAHLYNNRRHQMRTTGAYRIISRSQLSRERPCQELDYSPAVQSKGSTYCVGRVSSDPRRPTMCKSALAALHNRPSHHRRVGHRV
ncbi:hypothetical protein BDW02DRAFT_583563 [Decorospora gaudefroyi]|uniref:Uncharacterized protein n=1 Tax=Decorospora gaudefroyi TaxID=184978 RepID=A0A6A5JXJ5_9PLEO|nr:hypothetical protein BDW02DRAFT_583563 [Decorospora gaudefroyi]